MIVDTTHSVATNVHGLPWDAAHWTGGFWNEVVRTNDERTVPFLEHMFDSPDISHIVENFRICAGEHTGDHAGTVFGDGDFYKWIEAATYTAERNGDKQLHARIDAYIDLIGRAQRSDGYLSTKQIISETGPLADINDFEIYNMGHLFTAACVHTRLTGETRFLEIAEKAAGCLESIYAHAEQKGMVKTAVCPSHYMGLLELYRTTGNPRYLVLAKKAIALRDSVEDGTDDNQDRQKLLDQREIKGHAVRANYLYAGVADLFLETGDAPYLKVLHSVWNDLVTRKIYITGGCGALYNGASPYGDFFHHQLVHQAYGYPYQLPNITAYNETCANVGLVLWAYRMFLIEPQARYFDIMEQTILNAVLAGVSVDGTRFFYENMLRRAKNIDVPLVWPLTRKGYISSYCCPPNLTRLLSESSEYIGCVSEDSLYLGLYGDARIHLVLDNGLDCFVREETEYPYDGEISLTLENVAKAAPFHVNVRVPSWCRKGNICLPNGNTVPLPEDASGTFFPVQWDAQDVRDGNKLVIRLQMDACFVIADTRVEEDVNQAAVMRGPLVYCMERVDNPDAFDSLVFDCGMQWKPVPGAIGGRACCLLDGTAVSLSLRKNGDGLYQQLHIDSGTEVPVRLIPYALWDNRGEGEMKVFLPLTYHSVRRSCT
jgi:DUF1680 family protein